MEQQLTDTLHQQTLILLDHWEPERRQRSMHHFMEGMPLRSGYLFGINGSACLLGSGYLDTVDYSNAHHMIDGKCFLGSITTAFDNAAILLGIEQARSIVIEAMREWLSSHQEAAVEDRELVAA